MPRKLRMSMTWEDGLAEAGSGPTTNRGGATMRIGSGFDKRGRTAGTTAARPGRLGSGTARGSGGLRRPARRWLDRAGAAGPARAARGPAAAALSPRQQHRLLDAAAILLATNPDWQRDSIRFDLILVDRAGTVRRIADAFRDERGY